MISEVDVINAGLRLIGVQGITSLDEGTDRAFDAKLYWQTSFEAFLGEHHWSFARKEARLARIQEQERDVFGEEIGSVRDSEWRYAYMLPRDFLKLTRIVGCREQKYNIRRVGKDLGLLCNHPSVTIVYVSRDVPLEIISAAGREALACRLAMFVDSARNGGANQENLLRMYQGFINSAIRIEPTTHDRKTIDEGAINRARYDESANHCFAHKLRIGGGQSGDL